MKKRQPLQVRMQRWAQLANIGRLMLSEIDVHQILEAAADDVWRSLKKWGVPDQHANHPIYCTCADCT